MIAVLLLAVFVTVQSRTQLESEVRPYNANTSSWIKGARVNGDVELDLTVQIRIDQKGLDELERIFWSVSDPRSPHYGMHRTPKQVGQILNVPSKRIALVQNFFLDAGASMATLSPQRDMLTVRASVRVIEKALETELFYFSHSEWPLVKIIRSATTYSLPENVAKEVVIVGELVQFPRLKSRSLYGLGSGSGSWPNDCESEATCKGKVTPGVIKSRYKISDTASSDKNKMAVAEFQGQYFKHKDLELFSTNCHVKASVDVIIGGNVESAGIEAELDIEYIDVVAPEVPLTVIYSSQYSLLNWCNKIVSNDSSPYVHSVSYGNDEAQQTSVAYMFSCNTVFQKAGVQGLSILFASGDQGVCGREGCGVFKKKFHPDFPAASPYITAVGGTDFLTNDIGEETTWASGGGGFSDTFPIPDYQAQFVAAYKANPDANLPPQSMWNNTGRGYPDVAALGGQKAPYCIASNGRFLGVAGTSASCPVVAGVFAKLNGIRLSNGKPVLGFLNPFIYQNPDAFQDVTSGKNDEGRGNGFTAIKGWDAATGFGTPNFDALSKLV